MADFDHHSDDIDVHKVRDKAEEGKKKNLEKWWFF